MGDIGVPLLLIMLAIVIIVFGPARIGGIGKSLGTALRSLRQQARGEPAQQALCEHTDASADASAARTTTAGLTKPAHPRK